MFRNRANITVHVPLGSQHFPKPTALFLAAFVI